MTWKDWVPTVSLLITIITLVVAQFKANAVAKDAARSAKITERRTEVKLKLYQLVLRDDRLTLSEIEALYKQTYPIEAVDHIEINKAVYEILVDDSIVAYPDRTFTANSIEEDHEYEPKPKQK